MDRARRRNRSPIVRMLSPVRDFLATEASGAILIVCGAAIALVWANSPWSTSYADLWEHSGAVSVAGHTLDLNVRQWVNDGLMTIFFFVVGLEIKRELTDGHLASNRAALLPVAAALGGMLAPALVYLAIAGTSAPRGWAIPMATDIALAVGVLALVGSRIPASLRAFLLGLAIVDDIGAIVIIAAVYSTGVSVGWLTAAAVGIAATIVAKRLGVHWMWVYVIIGTGIWLSLHEGGIHPTIAGVAMGLLAPTAVVGRLQHLLHPWTSYLIVPIFALANSGIEISGDGLRDAARSPITWGVFFGLVAGKPIGIVVATTLSIRGRIADSPSGALPQQLVGVGVAGGIGFTVALFITELAFTDPIDRSNATLAILVASVVAAVASSAILVRSPSIPSMSSEG